jgi:hypothetical protein
MKMDEFIIRKRGKSIFGKVIQFPKGILRPSVAAMFLTQPSDRHQRGKKCGIQSQARVRLRSLLPPLARSAPDKTGSLH